MATIISYDGRNSGFQAGVINGNVTTQFVQSQTLNQACLQDLRTTNPHDDKDRIQNTNGRLLKDSFNWILDNAEFIQWRNHQNRPLLWIRGDPGKGKTMLLCGIIDELTRSYGDTANISFFFCQATDVRINNATAVLRGLIYLLVQKQPSLLSHVQSQYDQAGKALFEDVNAWNALSRIFMDILRDATTRSTYLIIDALDECTISLPSLLDLLAQVSSGYPHVKLIVSSRNWPDIEKRLNTTQTAPISLELNEASISEAVSKFIQHKVHHLAKAKRYSDETRDIICRYLSSNSQGTFLWVALVCQDLERTSRWHALQRLEVFPLGLDALYSRMIDQVLNSEDAALYKRILAVMSIVYRPIAIDELASLVELPDDLSDDSEAILEIIAICGSFLTVREDTIIFVHQSAKEFLIRETQNGVFPQGIEAEHYSVFSRTLQAMSKTLRRDIFQLKYPGFPIEKVKPPSPNPLAAIKYACVYWVDHLYYSGSYKKDDLSVDGQGYVGAFLQKKYLYWLEALSLLGSLSQGIVSILKLDALLREKRAPASLIRRVQDASRFIRYHRLAIESSPLQVYSSSLIFSPMLSLTRICYQKERPDWIMNEPLQDKEWSACLQTLEAHSDRVTSIAWSQNGSQLASASNDKTVRIWNPATGHSVSTLRAHRDRVTSIAWSQDGSQLASASDDKTVRILDPATGHSVSTLRTHRHRVHSIAWSQDGSRLALASDNKTVRIWDPATSHSVSTLRTHRHRVHSIAWSQDGSQLASASLDDTIRIWDPATGQCVSTLKGHRNRVNSIAWSQDGSRLASASWDNTIKIWDPATGQCASTLEGRGKWVTLIAWSQDGSRLASASDDKTVRIWNPATGHSVSTLRAHRDQVTSITWSQDGSRLASASLGNTIRIWDPATGQCVSTLEEHNSSIELVAWSQDGSRLASASWDNTVKIWDPATGQCVSTLGGYYDRLGFPVIAWSQDGSRLASGSWDSTIRIWDPATGQCVLTLKEHSDRVKSIAWSQDGSRLASSSDDKTVRIWDPATGNSVFTLQAHSDQVISIAWSQDGSRLVSASDDKTVRIWDPATGQCESTLHISSPFSLQLIFNHLQRSNGTFEIGSTGPVTSDPHCLTSPEQCGYGLNDDRSWVTYNGVNLLWLPAEFRKLASPFFAMSAMTLAIGCSSGRVIFLVLAE